MTFEVRLGREGAPAKRDPLGSLLRFMGFLLRIACVVATLGLLIVMVPFLLVASGGLDAVDMDGGSAEQIAAPPARDQDPADYMI